MSESARPLLRVVRGTPDDAELAALAAVVAAAAGAGEVKPEPAGESEWGSHARALRQRLSPGAGAWRASGLPS
ncbi:acyl-CoA carboxylase epsilon subunit [Amycolatopsis nigrescens]|uniref:acyl-CoA carboxylase epsilon subunit n=1 Tax=Amycolatopsis nigrescens TaxID=381445 RepID=UPI000365365A|nr:acyl-CoA carboxylase epsilon subunit [Amycolatopsis nigrescens]